MGDHLDLRPPHEGDLTIIEKLTQDPEVTGEFAWFGWHDSCAGAAALPRTDCSATSAGY